MRIAVTGANGYLGQHTIRKAIQQGWDVVGVVRRKEAAIEIVSLGAKAFVVSTFESNALNKEFVGCQAVIHLAGIVCGSRENFKSVNIEGTRAVVKAAGEAGIKRVVYPSGLGLDQYDKVAWATNEYFRSKMLAEQIIQKGGVPFAIFRPSYILGPNDELIPELVRQIAHSTVVIAGDGKVPMQPIYVENAISAFLAAAEGKGKNNTIYNLVGPKIVNMLQIVEIVTQTMKHLGFNVPEPRLKYISYEKAPQELGICKEMVDVMQCNIISDGNIASKALGYTLSSLEDAIKAAVADKLLPKQDKTRKRAIVLISGGIDSATTLYWAKNEGYDLLAISYNYYMRPEKERQAAVKLCELTNTRLIEVPIPFLKDAIDLKVEGLPVPCAVNAPEGYIPVRNLLFYAIAAYYAEAYGIDTIMGGHLAEDANYFPDASAEFFKSLEKLISRGKHCQDKMPINFLFPLAKTSKIEALKLAKKLKVPMELTWSCYSEDGKPCGKCASCINRKEAFIKAGFSDPEFIG